MLEGIIFKGIGGFYYVKTADALYECKARGKFKNKNLTPMVGDYVSIEVHDEEKKLGTIEEIHDRKNQLLRPSVSNVDQAIIVFALKNPDPNWLLLDKMIVLAEEANLEIVLCLNKCDLDENTFDEVQARYLKAGYTIMKTCAKSGMGVDQLKEHLKGKISVFSGPSGVGKSSLLNTIQSGLSLQVGEISEKIKRGKHTTRHSELLELKTGGIVVDTPGFTSLSLSAVEVETLKDYFPEFHQYQSVCRFDNCLHINEPQCEVKRMVDQKEIHNARYEAYLYLLEEIKNERKKKKW